MLPRMNFVLTIAFAVIIAACGSASASANRIVTASLIEDHFHWLGHALITEGYLRLQGGTFEVHTTIGVTKILRGPYISRLEADPKAGDTAVLFGLAPFHGHSPDYLIPKQSTWLSKWFVIEVASASNNPLTCPSKTCPIEISGELEVEGAKGEIKSMNHEPERYRVTNADFVFQDVTADLVALQSKADQGNAAAQYELGNLYNATDTPGIQYDVNIAAALYKKAAAQGYVSADNSLGDLYATGRLEFNASQAIRWYRIAAEKGDLKAQFRLGYTYCTSGSYIYGKGYEGQGIEHDINEGIKWIRKAADRGSAGAQNDLGERFEYGDCGVTKDYAEAYFWYLLAARSSDGRPTLVETFLHGKPDENAQRVAKQLTDSQRELIQQRVLQWKPTQD
jgi:TPR repeat protein